MQAYKVHAVLPESHHLTLTIPAEMPAGEVEVIVLAKRVPTTQAIASERSSDRSAALESARVRFGRLLASSDDFARAKADEVELEERRFDR